MLAEAFVLHFFVPFLQACFFAVIFLFFDKISFQAEAEGGGKVIFFCAKCGLHCLSSCCKAIEDVACSQHICPANHNLLFEKQV